MNRFLEFLDRGMDDYYNGSFLSVYQGARDEIKRIMRRQASTPAESCISDLMTFPYSHDPWIVDMVYDDYYACVKRAAQIVDTSEVEAMHEVAMMCQQDSAEQSEAAWRAALHGSIRNVMMMRTCDLVDMDDGMIQEEKLYALISVHGQQDAYDYLSGSSRINRGQCAEFNEWVALNGSAYRAEQHLYNLAMMALEGEIDTERVLSAAQRAWNGDDDLFVILGAVYDYHHGFREHDWTALELYSGGKNTRPEDLPELIGSGSGGPPSGELKTLRERFPMDIRTIEDEEFEGEGAGKRAVKRIDGWGPSPSLTINERLLAANRAVIRYAKMGDPDCLSVVLDDPERYGVDGDCLVDSLRNLDDGDALGAIADHYREERRHSLSREFSLKAIRAGNFEALDHTEWDEEVREAVDCNFPTDVSTDDGLKMAIIAAKVHYRLGHHRSAWSKLAIAELERRSKAGVLEGPMMRMANDDLKCEAFRVNMLLDGREKDGFFPWDWEEDADKDVLEIEFLIDRNRYMEAAELLCDRYWPLTRFGYSFLLKAYLGTIDHDSEDEVLLELHRLSTFHDYVSGNTHLRGIILDRMREAAEKRRQAYPPADSP